MQGLLNNGDEILIPSPDYPLWTACVTLAGGKPVHYLCDEGAEWYPDLDDIRSKITSKTKAIVLINPNNPTGALYPKQLLEDIISVAREHQLVIFSDEIYDRLVMDELEHISTATLCPDLLCITMNGLSKSHCLCGFRSGWLIISGPAAARRDLGEALLKLASIRLSANAIMQTVIPAALADTDYTEKLINPGGRLYAQRKATCEALDRLNCLSYEKNDGAFYIFPK